MTSKGVLFIFPGKIGDALMATAAVRALKKHYAPCTVDWAYDDSLTPFFSWLATTDVPVTRYFAVRDGIPDESNIFRMHWAYHSSWQWGKLFPEHEVYVNPVIMEPPKRFCHLSDEIAQRAGVAPLEGFDEIRLKIAEPVENRGYLLIHAHAADAERRPQVLYKARWPEGTVSPQQNGEAIPDHATPVHTPTFQDLVHLVAGASAVIAANSCVAILAAMIGKPTVCVHTITNESVAIARLSRMAVDLLDVKDRNYVEGVARNLMRSHADDRKLVLAR